jgi:hypothetical protein
MRLKLDARQVRQAVRETARGEYERIAPTFADTAADQWRLAHWCREHELPAQRTTHLQRVLALDPNHQLARASLGYHFIQGEWLTQEEFRRREGYEFYRGRWRTAQEIEILEARSKRELSEKEWLVRLKRLRSDLDSDRAQAAYASLAAIGDPAAVKPIASNLSRERVRRVKLLYCEILANIATPEAIEVLIHAALGDPDEEVFYYAVDKIVRRKQPHIADPFIAALQDKNNIRVNRAAMALAKIGDKSAISPLIDALVTTHARTLPGRPGMGPDATSSTFSSQGTSLTKNEGPQVLVARVQNQPVLDALAQLSGGVSFGFDGRAWRYWLAQEKQAQQSPPAVEMRR